MNWFKNLLKSIEHGQELNQLYWQLERGKRLRSEDMAILNAKARKMFYDN